MKLPGWLNTVRKVLGAITDLLLKGREAGLYDQKPGTVKPVAKDEGPRR